MTKLKVNMYATGLNIKGQGVGANFYEQVAIIKSLNDFEVSINGSNPNKYDINHFHTLYPSFIPKLRKKNINICYVHFIPEIDDGSLKMPKLFFSQYRNYVIKFYKKADEVVVVNPYFISKLIEIGLPKEKITYIPNCVSDKAFYKIEDKNKIKELKVKYNLDVNKFTVLGVGQTQTRKGILDFAEVAMNNPEIQFIWAGGFSFGHLTSGYEEIKELMSNPPKNMRFLGIIDREYMNEIYNVADVLFLPSYQELFPVTLLECVNVEKPFLVRDLDLYKDIFFSKYLVATSNDEFSRILRELKNNSEYYSTAVQQSIEIKKYYSVPNVSKIWDKYYKDVFNKYSFKKNKTSL